MLVVIVAVVILIGVLLFSNEAGRKQRLSQLKTDVRESKKNFENYLISISNTNITGDGAFEMAVGLNRIYFAEHLYEAVRDQNEDKEQKLNATMVEQISLINETSHSLYKILSGRRIDLKALKTASRDVGKEMKNEFTLFVHD